VTGIGSKLKEGGSSNRLKRKQPRRGCAPEIRRNHRQLWPRAPLMPGSQIAGRSSGVLAPFLGRGR
jgi:hypothetical protein